jgi:UDP-N-acetylmuramoyl-tripeptide--D-alanyl-D-alanine ligase
VPDSLKGLQELAREHRRKFDIPIVAIAGSNGKTSTKELVASVLSQKFKTLKTEGTLNNHIGVPLTLLRLDQTHKAAVIEMGTNHPGEVATLCEIAEPTHGLITNIMREHMEFFGTIENVARAEGELFDWLAQSDGAAFVNVDEPLIISAAAKLKKRCRYGFTNTFIEVHGTDKGAAPDGTGLLGVDCRVRHLKFEARVGLVGRHHIHNALAAVTVGVFFGVPQAQIQLVLANQQPAKHRMNVYQLSGVTIIDDTYNANPDSMLAALRTLADLSCKGRRIAALGNMGELGEKKEEYHREIGAAVRELGIQMLFTVGDLGRFIFEAAAVKSGIHCKDRDELTQQLNATIREGDVLLLKASRSVKLDLVVDALKKA